ncbi:hypothetical protein SIAM614_18724 [Roseibium aggregatum IAM 12614]|uniref:Uncharacterized protein n=1 Tax=Roseibium aggregatum (strain ATCC 25650 / DSM 13394 / JCM 20685 / NBRC 16684 / NCIMB 2208 / IAM 12614 / B1) TaxID=384765 RepID=A0NPM5_ROSAI|nr:hypothetical protein SIAM614_18724 [Roseibium aggregatum IAM 12614]
MVFPSIVIPDKRSASRIGEAVIPVVTYLFLFGTGSLPESLKGRAGA